MGIGHQARQPSQARAWEDAGFVRLDSTYWPELHAGTADYCVFVRSWFENKAYVAQGLSDAVLTSSACKHAARRVVGHY